MRLEEPGLDGHRWLLDAVREGLTGLGATELATFPVEAPDGALERLMIATDLGQIEGTLTGPPIDGFPGLVLDLRLWRDVRVSARARVDTQHGAHAARLILTVNDRTVSSYELRTRDAAESFIAAVLTQASQASRA